MQKIKGVEEVAMVNGIYDIVTKISGINLEDLERTNMKMREIDTVSEHNDTDRIKNLLNYSDAANWSSSLVTGPG